MFETLTALLPMLEKTKPDQWIVAGSDNGTDGDGQPDLMPCYVYGPGARQLMEAIGRFAHEHGELKLYDYPRILQEAGLWESPDKADVSTLDGRSAQPCSSGPCAPSASATAPSSPALREDS